MSAPTRTRRPAHPGIDPRLRARRVAVARAQGRRRLRILVGVVVAASVVGLGWLAVQSPLLDVDRIRVDGAEHLSAAEVRRTTGVDRRDALLLVDPGAVSRRVERLPWAASVSVHRRLPGTLTVRVTERRPVAWAPLSPRPARPSPSAAGAAGRAGTPKAGTGSGPVALVDADGRVLAHVAEPPGGLGELLGVRRVPRPGGFVGPGGAVLRAVAYLPPGLRAYVETAGMERGRAVVRFHSGPGAPSAGEIRFGGLDALREKADAAAAVIRALGAGVAYVDVSVPDAPATG